MPKAVTPLSNELRQQWLDRKNLPLTKDSISAGSSKKVWWECGKGHEWEAQVKARSRGNGCPYCSGRLVVSGVTDMATLNPAMALQWHSVKNGELLPSDVTLNSSKKVWWECGKGHEWQGAIINRSGVAKDGQLPCPVCSGAIFQEGVNDFSTLKPDLVRFWSDENTKKPHEVTAKSSKTVVWECEFGHKSKSKVMNFSKCPVCSGRQFESGINDLGTLYKDLMPKWDFSANESVPSELPSTSSSIRYFWLCDEGHSWKASILELREGMTCTVCSFKVADPCYNTLDVLYPVIASEWDYDKNTKKPSEVTPKNMSNVWWVCSALSHSWKGTIGNRVKGAGCAVCEGREVLAGFNDLSTTHPFIASQWSTKNTISLLESGSGSSLTAQWECDKGHEWEAQISARTRYSSGCPYCSVRKFKSGVNDLLILRPDVAQYWSGKNSFLPTQVSTGYNEKVWWDCPQGHTYQMTVIAKTSASYKCPVCSGRSVVSGVNDFFTVCQELRSMWSDKNTIDPMTITPRSNKKALWVCEEGHEWEAVVQAIVEGGRCPYCLNKKVIVGYNDLFTIKPELKTTWDFDKNEDEEIYPEEYTYGSKTRAWWKCDKGHSWRTMITDRSRGIGCPYCEHLISRGEQEVYDFIVSLGVQAEQSNRKVLKGKELDIYIPSKGIAFEYNGLYWHSELYRDKDYHYKKHQMCTEAGIQLIQIWEDDWRDNRVIIKNMIQHKLGVSDFQRVYGRKTQVNVLDYDTASNFLSLNHIQGRAEGCKFIGLSYNEDTVAVMAFREEGEDKDICNIVRYATDRTVIGGFGKLLAYLESNNEFKSLYTFSDNEVSNGSLYSSSGFIVSSTLPADYSYVYQNSRHHKYRFRKSRFEKDASLQYEEGLTEYELARLNGLTRVFDSGKIRWVKHVQNSSGV